MREGFEAAYQFLEVIEPDLRDLIVRKQIGSRLLDEITPIEVNPPYSPVFHQGGEETYGFARNKDDGPSRSIRWYGEDGNYYFINMYYGGDPGQCALWTVASPLPFGSNETRLFDELVVVATQDPRPFRELLEERFTALTSTPGVTV